MELDKQRKNFMEELGPKDVAIVFKNDGKLKLYLLDHPEGEERQYTDPEILVMALGKLLGHRPFVENVVNTFFKILERTNQKVDEISKDVEQTKKEE